MINLVPSTYNGYRTRFTPSEKLLLRLAEKFGLEWAVQHIVPQDNKSWGSLSTNGAFFATGLSLLVPSSLIVFGLCTFSPSSYMCMLHVRNRPEGCIAEETIAEETIEFFREYHKSMKTIGIPPDKHETDENEEGKLKKTKKRTKIGSKPDKNGKRGEAEKV
nr:hypothetical protein [Tanacetum cinerariifolium]